MSTYKQLIVAGAAATTLIATPLTVEQFNSKDTEIIAHIEEVTEAGLYWKGVAEQMPEVQAQLAEAKLEEANMAKELADFKARLDAVIEQVNDDLRDANAEDSNQLKALKASLEQLKVPEAEIQEDETED